MIAEQIRCVRLVLQPLRVSHAPGMSRVLADPALYSYSGGEPPSIAELTARYERQTAGRSVHGRETWLNWVVTDLAGEPLGYVQATVTGAPDGAGVEPAEAEAEVEAAPEAEVAWVVASSQQGRGYATESALAMVDWLRTRGVTQFMAHIHPDHRASQAVARHLGLHPTANRVDGEDRWES